jgi:hypothetical protein
VNQWHENPPVHTAYLTHRLFGLAVTALITFIFNAFIYPLGVAALLLWKALVGGDDLCDALKKGANFWLGPGPFYPITRRLRMR